MYNWIDIDIFINQIIIQIKFILFYFDCLSD